MIAGAPALSAIPISPDASACEVRVPLSMSRISTSRPCFLKNPFSFGIQRNAVLGLSAE